MSERAEAVAAGGQPSKDGGGGARLDEAEVYKFARYLGMDPEVDGHLLWIAHKVTAALQEMTQPRPLRPCMLISLVLMWIAHQALNAVLPSSWSEHKDDDGSIYYFNADSGDSAWEHPMDDYYRRLYQQHKNRERAQEPATTQDRFPAFVSFPVKDPCAAAAAAADNDNDSPVGPRERVKK